MATNTGVSSGFESVDWLAGQWLNYQQIKHGVDLERASDDTNVNDRVDVAHGYTDPVTNSYKSGAMTWAYIGAGLAAVFGLTYLMNRK